MENIYDIGVRDGDLNNIIVCFIIFYDMPSFGRSAHR